MKRKSSLKRVLSLFLALGTVLTSALPAGGQHVLAADLPDIEAVSVSDSLVAHYKFDGDFKDALSESTGTTEGSSVPTIADGTERGQVMKSGSGNGRVKTNNPLYGDDLSQGFTVSAWVDANAVDTWLGIWSFSSGTTDNNGFYGLSTNGSLYFNDLPSSATYQDMKEFGGTITADGGWEYITVVMDDEQISMYKDGELAKQLTPYTNGVKPGQGTSYMLDFVSQWQYIYFGTASPRYWNSGDFYLDDFKVYNKALTGEEVLETYVSDRYVAAELVTADKNALSLPETAIADLTLPTVGSSGYTAIAWTSDNTAVIANEGTVTRPAEETTVQLTATISLNDITDQKTFSVTVHARDDSSDLAYYKDQLTLNAGYITADLQLPATIGNAAISWASDSDAVVIEDNTAKVTRPAGENEEVTLTATLTLNSATDTKKIPLVVLAQGSSVVSYVSNDPDLSTDGLRGQTGGMKIAGEGEGGTFTALHKDQPILYTAQGAKAYAAPTLFRKANGTFGMIAADGGNNGNVLVYASEDLIDYTNEHLVTLPNQTSIAKLSCVYDMTMEQYLLYAADKDGVVHTYTSKDLTSFTGTGIAADYAFVTVDNAPSDAVWASEIALTQAEYDKLAAKFTNPYNTSLTGEVPAEVTVAQNGDAEAALDAAVGELTATYSNGEERSYTVRWNAADLEKVDTSRPGIQYTIRGTIGGTTYYTEALEPLIEERADPCIAYDEENDCYYFTASYPVNGKDGADGYDRLVIRKADTIEGLATAEEHVIWDESENEGFGQFIWAPELHNIGGSWYFLSTAALVESGYSFNLRPFLLKCNNADDITNPASWGEPQRINLKSGDTTGLNAMSLDMTYFEVGDKAYYAWADFTRNADNPNGVSSIYIASVDPSNPTQLTSNCVVIAVPEYSWEIQRYTVNEGPSVLQKDGKVYMAFSASGTGAEYCIGLLTADATSDLLDSDSWTKTPYPIMTSGDFNDELCGPGHNSFTVNEDGDPVIVYHARPADLHAGHGGDPLYDACRYAYVKPVFFDSEGMPVLNMSDEEFIQGGTEVVVTLTVDGEAQEAVPVLEYNFDETLQEGTAADSVGDNDAKLVHGQYVDDPSYGQVLYLDGDTSVGGSNSYLEFPAGYFDGKDSLTISMDVNEVTRWGNYFTFTIGQDNQKYLFFKLMPDQLKLAITTGSYSTEQVASWSGAYPNNSRTWVNFKLVIAPNSISIYRDGQLVAENQNTGISISDLGTGLKAYLGKSFYDPDLYFRGYFDNVKVYDYAMSDWEVQTTYAREEAERLAMLEDVQRVAETFEIPNADDIRGNITLPSEKDGVSITWQSSDEDVINTAVVANDNYDSTPAGVVTRGETDQTVTLTATFSKDGQTSVTKTYEVVVKAKAEEVTEDDYVGYLFVHFTGSEANAAHEQTYFSISRDGLNWTDLNDNQPVLTSNIGESGLRDHFIARAPEGDRYYMIATDLSIYHNGGNWPGAGGSGSHGIVVWESDDLVNWSEPWIAEIAPENAGCTWAPEFIYDEVTGEYVVYWASTTIELDDNEQITQEYENHAIYYAKTRDFRTFTEPELYHAGGEDSNGVRIKVIDSTMIEDGGKYYRYTKNESRGIIEIDVSDNVLGEFTPIASTTLSSTLPAQQGAVEGPIIFKLNEKDADGNDQWCLMVDRYARGQGYYPLITNDLASGVFTLLSNSDFSMPSKYRHGYVMPLTAAEYDALQRTYGEDSYVSTLKLEEAIADAKAIDTSLLTDDSAKALPDAIAAAETALAQGFQTTAEADAAAATLRSVLDSLVYRLTGLEVTAPTKTAYTKGEALDTTGMIVTAVYGDGSTTDVTAQAQLSGYNGDTLGQQTVTVTYTENGITQTATFVVTVSSSGSVSGGSSSGNQTETTTNPDGSTTTTVTKPDGSKTETTKAPNGSSSVVNTTKDGQVSANVTVSSSAVENAEGPVALPMPEVSVTDDLDKAAEITVDLPANTTVQVEIPVENATAGTVAVLVKADGTEEVIKTSFATEDSVVVEVSDGDTVKIVDNSKDFADVPASFWGADAVAFATSHELFNGTGETTFSPNAEMTRAMIVTVLARLEGVDTTTGDTWYEAGRQWAVENGISDGTNMMGSLTREQLATMLYRYVGEPAVSGAITGFADTASVSDWAEDAMTWAVQNGIISGSNGKLNPQNNATRAEVATMLMRFVKTMA